MVWPRHADERTDAVLRSASPPNSGRMRVGQGRGHEHNVFTRTNFNLPDGNRSSGNFGRITGASAAGGGSDPRILQLALRVWF